MQMDMSGGLPTGSLQGHALPGAFFLLWASFWLVGLLRGDAGEGQLEASGLVRLGKLFLPLIVIVGELSHGGLFRNWGLNNLQHATMYSAFVLSAVVDLAASRGWLPKPLTYYAFASACLVAGLLFLAHPNHGALATTVHLLLVAVFFALVLTAAIEAAVPSPGLAWMRTGLLVTLGTWFIQVGFSLYGREAVSERPESP